LSEQFVSNSEFDEAYQILASGLLHDIGAMGVNRSFADK
jgi:hypothetical protein